MSSHTRFVGVDYDEYEDTDSKYDYTINDSDNKVGGAEFKCINQSLIMNSDILIRNGDKITRNIVLFIRKHRDRYVIECIPYDTLRDYILKLDNCMFVWNPVPSEKVKRPIVKLPSTGIWIESPYEMLLRYSAFYIYDYPELAIGSVYEHFSSKISYERQHVGLIMPISKTDFLKTGKIDAKAIRENGIVLSDPLDWAPDEYPGYSVKLSYKSKTSIDETPIDIGLKYRFFFKGGLNLYINNDNNGDSFMSIFIQYKTLYGGFYRVLLHYDDTPGIAFRHRDSATVDMEYIENGKLVFVQTFSNLTDTEDYAKRESIPTYSEFLRLGIPEAELRHYFPEESDGEEPEQPEEPEEEDEEEEDEDEDEPESDGEQPEPEEREPEEIHDLRNNPRVERKEYDGGVVHLHTRDGDFWYKDGLLHRDDDLPAVWIPRLDVKEWWQNGKMHREDDKPAYKSPTMSKWYKYGLPHRRLNPAVVINDDSINIDVWYKHGKLHSRTINGRKLPAISMEIYGEVYKYWYRDGVEYYPQNLTENTGAELKENLENGGYQWIRDGNIHRTGDRPAVLTEYDDESNYEWYLHDLRHREDNMPADIYYTRNSIDYMWCFWDIRHRDGDMPAIISTDKDGLTFTQKRWFKDGNEYFPFSSDGDTRTFNVTRVDELDRQIDNNRTVIWRLAGSSTVHNLGDNPAIILPYGEKMWSKNGRLHRDHDLPAIITSNGFRYWRRNGEKYNLSVMKTLQDGTKMWIRINDDPDDETEVKHREDDLPAVIYPDGRREWWKDGRKYREEDPPVSTRSRVIIPRRR
jgi:hypothetical protein